MLRTSVEVPEMTAFSRELRTAEASQIGTAGVVAVPPSESVVVRTGQPAS